MRRADVLVLLLVLAAGAGLVVVVLANAAEESRRTGCMNNLKEIGLSLHNYHSTFRRFPCGTIPNRYLPPEKRLSWLVATISFIEQIRPDLDREEAWDADKNREPEGVSTDGIRYVIGEFPVYLCPANPSHGSPGWPRLMHYVGLAGVGAEAPESPLGDPGVGFFGYDRHITAKDVADGLGHTLAAIETNRDNGPWTAGGPPTVRGLDPGDPPYLGMGGQFGSFHPGGSHALFADGSVRFLPESLSPPVFEALATIAGGEKVPPLEGD